MQEVFDDRTVMGTLLGTTLSVFGNIGSEDMMKTVVLAGVGALVSFGVSVVLKAVVRYFRK